MSTTDSKSIIVFKLPSVKLATFMEDRLLYLIQVGKYPTEGIILELRKNDDNSRDGIFIVGIRQRIFNLGTLELRAEVNVDFPILPEIIIEMIKTSIQYKQLYNIQELEFSYRIGNSDKLHITLVDGVEDKREKIDEIISNYNFS